jgi:hypothetical protein
MAVAWLVAGPVAASGNPSYNTARQAAPADPARVASEAHTWPVRTGEFLKRAWGVEVLGVRRASSGWMLTFRYKVLDLDKAKALFDPKATAYLVDEASGARLAVPAMENIGELRQTKNAATGHEYYIMFGNGNQVVRAGARVDVVVGSFHAEGIIVE